MFQLPENEKLESKREDRKGFWESLSIIQKFVLFLIILTFVFIGWIFLFGGVNSIWELAFIIALIIVLFFIAWIVIAAVQIIFKSEYYSPKED